MLPCETCQENVNMRQFIEHTAKKERGLHAAIVLLRHNIKVLEKKMEKENGA